jgi:hypothetical protein
MSEEYDSRRDTMKHILTVRKYLHQMSGELEIRGARHDLSKMEEPEKEIFDVYTPKLAGSTYGSPDYKSYLNEMKAALDHHYSVNRHHPEHFENGIAGMNLADIVEMFCDWYAATKRHNDGDIMKSIRINQKRFGYSDDLAGIFENTARDFFKGE